MKINWRTNFTSIVKSTTKSCPAGERNEKGVCKCGDSESCEHNKNSAFLCDPEKSQCLCSKDEPACEEKDYCMNGKCSGNKLIRNMYNIILSFYQNECENS